MLKAIGRALGYRAADEAVSVRFISVVVADEWERMASDPRWSKSAELLREYASQARAKGCEQRQIGLADDHRYQTLLIIKCDTCGSEEMVRPNSPKRCFAHEKRTHADFA